MRGTECRVSFDLRRRKNQGILELAISFFRTPEAEEERTQLGACTDTLRVNFNCATKRPICPFKVAVKNVAPCRVKPRLGQKESLESTISFSTSSDPRHPRVCGRESVQSRTWSSRARVASRYDPNLS